MGASPSTHNSRVPSASMAAYKYPKTKSQYKELFVSDNQLTQDKNQGELLIYGVIFRTNSWAIWKLAMHHVQSGKDKRKQRFQNYIHVGGG